MVDEDEGVRESLSILLKRRGIQPVQAGNAAAAMERFSEDEFDLLVTNLDMPETNGLELIRWIRARSPFLPVIVLSESLSSDSESTGGLTPPCVVRTRLDCEGVNAAISSMLQKLRE